jgi:hypothetical protein
MVVSVERYIHDFGVVVEHVLCPVTMVHVPVDNQNTVKSKLILHANVSKETLYWVKETQSTIKLGSSPNSSFTQTCQKRPNMG